MAYIQFTAEGREDLLIELPAEAGELHLKAGDKVQVHLARSRCKPEPLATSTERNSFAAGAY